jgi:hypothetical protein
MSHAQFIEEEASRVENISRRIYEIAGNLDMNTISDLVAGLKLGYAAVIRDNPDDTKSVFLLKHSK